MDLEIEKDERKKKKARAEMRSREERALEAAERTSPRLTYDFDHDEDRGVIRIVAIYHLDKTGPGAAHGRYIRDQICEIPDHIIFADEIPDEITDQLWKLDLRLVPLLQVWLRVVHAPKVAGQVRLQAPDQALKALITLAAMLKRKSDIDLVRLQFEKNPELTVQMKKVWDQVEKGLTRENLL